MQKKFNVDVKQTKFVKHEHISLEYFIKLNYFDF